jgi:hypothetical protein
MGGEKQTTSTNQNSTQTTTADPSMVEQNRLDLELRKGNQQGMADIQASGLNLGNLLLRGQSLPGYLNTLPGGISEDVTQQIVDKSLRDVKGFGQQGGLLDSGTLQSIAGRTSGDIRMGSAQFNLQNLSQLLNLALGGQAQVQQPIIGQASALGQRLAGLSSVSQTGNSTQTTKSMNPFMKSFQTGMGSWLGGGAQNAAMQLAKG